ncbi:ATPase [Mucilaginibacter sp. PAMC 26640]|nr:ATPase [Mucilaginibacter sp. PAMC 26640]
MSNNLFFEFSVNKKNNTIRVIREFNGDPALVWKAWTTAELLDQWWGPEPCRVETKTMDFRPGGYWHYAMIVPDVGTFWSRVNYVAIETETSFSAIDGFCDENGSMSPNFAQNLWNGTFTTKGNKVKVDLLYTFDTLADLEKTLAMNFEEGFTKDLHQLDELLLTLKN